MQRETYVVQQVNCPRPGTEWYTVFVLGFNGDGISLGLHAVTSFSSKEKADRFCQLMNEAVTKFYS